MTRLPNGRALKMDGAVVFLRGRAVAGVGVSG